MFRLFSGIGRLLKKPVALGLAGIVGLAIGVLGLGGFITAVEVTNSTEFCVSCHEMRSTVYPEFQKTKHFKNASGVRAGCPDCHVPKDWPNKIVAKVAASNDLLQKILGTIDTPEKFEARRPLLAKRVWARMKASDSRECRNCHSYEAMDFAHQKPNAAEMMQKAVKDGGTCIDCHKGIAHTLPDMSSGYKQLFDELKAQAVKNGGSNPKSYALQSSGFWLEQPSGEAGSADGRIMPATPVTVLERKDAYVKVRISGWSQDGVSRMVVALPGKRIQELLIGAAAAEKAQIKVLSTRHDAETDLDWNEVAIEGWVEKANLVDDQKALWTYGSEMFEAACGACHSLYPTDHYPANQWTGIINRMKEHITLNDEQIRFIQAYAQYHAADVSKAPH